MKKLTAIFLAMALLVTAFPAAVFAEEESAVPEAVPVTVNGLQQINIEDILTRYGASLDSVTDQLNSWKDKIGEISTELAFRFAEAYGNAMENYDGLIERLEDFKTTSSESLKGYLETLNGYIDQANEMQAAFAEDPSISQAIENLKTATEMLKDVVSNLKDAVDNWIVQAGEALDIESIIADAKDRVLLLKEKLEGAIDDLKEKISAAIEEFKQSEIYSTIENGLKTFIENVKAWDPATEIKTQLSRVLLQHSETLDKLITAYNESGMPAALKVLVEQAKTVFREKADEVIESVQDQLDTLKNGASAIIDPILKRFGTCREEIEAKLQETKDLVQDIVAYGTGYANGQKYTTLEARVITAEAEAENLKKDNANFLTALNKAAAQNAKSWNETNTLKNAIKVVRGKPVVSSVKTKAGKKITIKWKPIKGAEISFYQVCIGKKVVKVNEKTQKLTQKNKSVKKVLKKYKKGQKVKVTVRAAYKVGEKTYYSKWTKAKKIVIK